MMILEISPTFVIGAIGLAITILGMLIKLVFSTGKIMSGMKHLEEKVEEAVDDIKSHASNTAVHVNKDLQEAMTVENRRFQEQTHTRLNEMSKDLRDLLLGRKGP